MNNTEGLATRAREGIEAFARDLPMAKAGGQVKRGARRFALIATAGEMATAAGLTGWAVGEATRAARICFDAWVRTRAGGVGASEQAEAVRQVQYWIEKNGDANLTPWGRIADMKKPNTPMRGGFRRLVDEAGVPIKLDSAQDAMDKGTFPETTATALALTEYLISVEPFKRDVCKGYARTLWPVCSKVSTCWCMSPIGSRSSTACRRSASKLSITSSRESCRSICDLAQV